MYEFNLKKEDMQVLEYFKNSIDLMMKFNIPPTPENYTVFYTFAEQKDKNLFNELAKIIDENKVNDLIIQELYEKYFFKPESKKIENIIERTYNTISDTENNLENLKDTYISTGKRIKNFIGKTDKNDIFKEFYILIKEIINQHKTTILLLKESNKKINQLKNEVKKLKYESYIDPLTEIFNRRKLFIELKNKVKNYKKNKEIYIIMADIDNFKKINDNFNHRVGDAVLRYVSQKMAKFVNSHDILARYGGEEFTIVFTKIDSDETAIKRIKEIRQAISEKILKVTGSNEILGKVTLSYGMVKYSQEMDMEKAIEKADILLYKAKETGKDRIVFLNSEEKELILQ